VTKVVGGQDWSAIKAGSRAGHPINSDASIKGGDDGGLRHYGDIKSKL
jgi:hypothetical protein